jgi:hypothetical protein
VHSFNCLLRIAFDRIQAATQCCKRRFEIDLDHFKLEVKALKNTRILRRFQRSRWRKAEQRISSLLYDITSLERAAAANILGFQHLCGQLSGICGSRTAADAALYAGKLDGYRDTQASESAACCSYASLRKVA